MALQRSISDAAKIILERSVRNDDSGCLEWKRLLAKGIPQSEIAEEFGVVQSIISRINTGARWAHVSNTSEGNHA